MMVVEIKKDSVRLDGHAENKIVCAMVTTMTVFFINSITEYLKERNLEYKLENGYLWVCIENLSDKAHMFFDAYKQELLRLCQSYPKSFDVKTSSL